MPCPQATWTERSEDPPVARSQGGDMEALRRLYVANERPVYRYAYLLLGHREIADDIKQETFVKARGDRQLYRGDVSPRIRLLHICTRLCRDRLGSAAPHDGAAFDPRVVRECLRREEAATPASAAESAPLLEAVLDVVRELPIRQREVLILRDVEGYGFEEAARVVGCLPLQARWRLFRARHRLNERLRALPH